MAKSEMGNALEYLERNREYLTHVEKSRIHTMVKTGRVNEAIDTITRITAERRRLSCAKSSTFLTFTQAMKSRFTALLSCEISSFRRVFIAIIPTAMLFTAAKAF